MRGDLFQPLRKCLQHPTVLLSACHFCHFRVGLSAERPWVQPLPRGTPSFPAQVMASYLLRTSPMRAPPPPSPSCFTSPLPSTPAWLRFLTITLSLAPPSSPFSPTRLPPASLSSLPLCLLFSEVSLQSKVVTLNSCFSNYPHVTGYLLIGGFP